MATAFMMTFAAVASPWLVALLRKRHWSDDVLQLVAVAVSFACFLLGQFADGALHWPLSETFWYGLAGAFGLNQAGYQIAKRVAPATLEKVEQL